MKSIILIVFFAFLLFPISSSFSQKVDEPSQFGIALTSTSPYYFKDNDGYTIVLGEIENLKNFPITGITVRAGFYDDVNEQPLETATGTTLIDVIPPFGKSPYMIKSPNPNSAITGVSVNLLGFTSAPPKNEQLGVDSEITKIGGNIEISGTIINNAGGEASQTKVHVAFFDAFQPPRILGVATIELGPLGGGSSANFEFSERFDTRSSGYKVFAESNNYHSNVQSVNLSPSEALTKLVTIYDVSVVDDEGKKLNGVTVDNRVTIKSKVGIQYSEDQETYEQPYRYYVQIKQSGEKAFVEFIGIYEDSFVDSGDVLFPSVKWTPQSTGLYFVETFVWDPNGVPLASKGPVILILVT